MLDLHTVNDVFDHMSHRGDTTVAMFKSGSEWKPISSKTMYGRVRALVAVLQSWGVQHGDRVALIGENRWEWPVVDFAVLALGAVDVPLYQTLTPEQVGYMLRNSGARVVFVSSKQQYQKVVAAGEIQSLERVVVWDEGDFPGADSFSKLLAAAPQLEEPDAAFDALVKQVKPEDLATIVYTSGTTGDPKGVMLTHENMATNLQYSSDDLNLTDRDSTISFLPLSHALARHLDYVMYSRGCVIAYLPKFDDLRGAMAAVKPTVFLAVPRVFEKIRQGIEGKSQEGLKGKIFRWALKVGAKNRAKIMEGKTPGSLSWKLANKLVYSKILEAFGGNAKLFVSGGAPLGKENSQWFLDVNIRIFEGYGLTETSPVISRNTFAGYRMGSVGTVLSNIEVRLAPDGELEVRGSCVFKGFWQNPEATQKEFTEDGWFKTGDIASYTEGFLAITDRKKELLKTSGGKYIAPQPIEGNLKVNSLVNQAALIGDQKKFASVLISPNLATLVSWAAKNGVQTEDKEAMVKDPKVFKLYKSIIDETNKNLADYERIKKFAVVPEEWNVDTGELTPSLKLKRRVIVERYKDQIAALYNE